MGLAGRLLAVAVLAPAAAVSRHGSLRAGIINGTVVEQSSPYHKFFALMTDGPESDTWLGCGASIISPTFALTSAHCFGGGKEPCKGPKQLALWVGEIQLVTSGMAQTVGAARPDGQSFRVQADMVCDPDFDGKCSHGNDAVLLKLHEAVPGWVKPVTLDLDGAGADAVGAVVTAMGHGLTEKSANPTFIAMNYPSTLREVSVTVLAQDTPNCGHIMSGGYGCSDEDSEGPATNTEMQLCVGADPSDPKDTCAGDSGSPMVDASGVQVGIVSYGGGPGQKLSGPGRMCGDPAYPGVYAKVSAYKSFILDNVHDLPQQ